MLFISGILFEATRRSNIEKSRFELLESFFQALEIDLRCMCFIDDFVINTNVEVFLEVLYSYKVDPEEMPNVKSWINVSFLNLNIIEV